MKKRAQPPPGKRILNVGVAALARELGLSEAVVSRKMSAGKSADEIRAEHARRHGGGRKPPGRPPLPNEYEEVIRTREFYNELEEMKLRRAKALAIKQEMDNLVKSGDLLPISYVRKYGIQFLTEGRDELAKGP